MMRLAYSTNAFKGATLEEAIESIARIGYAGVEIMADVPHAYPELMTDERIGRVRGRLADLNLAISNVNAFTLFAQGDTYHPTWIENDSGLRAQRIAHTQAVIRMAGKLGVETISLQPGGPLGGTGRGEGYDRFEAGLRACLPTAEAEGIVLMIEPEPGLLIQHSWECLEFMQRLRHPLLKMNADLGHFYCVGEEPAEVLRKCSREIAHVHLEDIGDNRVHQHRVPGEGAMDWDGIFRALGEINYQKWLTVELYPYEATAEEAGRRALRFLEKYL